MPAEARLRGAIAYVLSVGLGVLLAKIAPPWLLLPVFFGCLACILILTVAAHSVSTQAGESGYQRFALTLFALLFWGQVGIESKGGWAPRAFIMALLFMLGLVLVLALSSGAA